MVAVWLCGSLALVLFAGLAWYLAPLEPGVVALQLAFTPQAFNAIIQAWPAEHLARYRLHLPFDCLLLLAYGSLGYMVATRSRVFARFGPTMRWLATWALPTAALGDATENALHGWLTEAPHLDAADAHAAAAMAATFKWSLIGVFVALVACALLRKREA